VNAFPNAEYPNEAERVHHGIGYRDRPAIVLIFKPAPFTPNGLDGGRRLGARGCEHGEAVCTRHGEAVHKRTGKHHRFRQVDGSFSEPDRRLGDAALNLASTNIGLITLADIIHGEIFLLEAPHPCWG